MSGNREVKNLSVGEDFVAIRSVFAYNEGSSAGSGAGETLPDWQSGFTRKGLQLCGLWAFVSLPVTAALKGSKNAKP